MSILYVGIATQQEIRQRTMDIASGKITPKAKDPKVWFSSIESLAQVLSADNRAMLKAIREHHPDSVSSLAKLVGRAQPNLTRTLKKLASFGIVELKKDGNKAVPLVVYDEISMHVQLAA